MSIEKISSVFLILAILHSFLTPLFAKVARKLSAHSAPEAFFHLLSEIEVVFGFWASLFLLFWLVIGDAKSVIDYQQSLQMTEPLFIFCIMIVSSTKPVVQFAKNILIQFSKLIALVFPFNEKIIQIFVVLGIGPLLGSFITEPAAMTILALLLLKMFHHHDEFLLYAIIGVLFVNISVGGGLTHFAAPPILIVAQKFGWQLKDVFINMGEAVICGVLTNVLLLIIFFRKRISSQLNLLTDDSLKIPFWVTAVHILFLVLIVLTSHYEKVFMGLFLIFIGVTTVTKKYQETLKFKEGFLVAFFLAGLIVFGSLQKWWLTPLLAVLQDKTLYFVATALTAITDNAALTFLGSQVDNLAETSKWALVSGAITGGGLTILANAPNPAGFAILSSKFKNSTLNSGKLFIAALLPTGVVIIWFLILGRF